MSLPKPRVAVEYILPKAPFSHHVGPPSPDSFTKVIVTAQAHATAFGVLIHLNKGWVLAGSFVLGSWILREKCGKMASA